MRKKMLSMLLAGALELAALGAAGYFIYQIDKKMESLQTNLDKVESLQTNLIKKQNEQLLLIKEQGKRIKTHDIQMGAVNRQLSNQSKILNEQDTKISEQETKISELDTTTSDLSQKSDTPVTNENSISKEDARKVIVEMPVLESYQIVLPKSQKVYSN